MQKNMERYVGGSRNIHETVGKLPISTFGQTPQPGYFGAQATKSLVRAVDTRWGSTHESFERLIIMASHVMAILGAEGAKKAEKAHCTKLRLNLDKIKLVAAVLRPVSAMSKYFECTQSVLGEVLPNMCSLQHDMQVQVVRFGNCGNRQHAHSVHPNHCYPRLTG